MTVNEEIKKALAAIEEKYNVKVILAAITGSRYYQTHREESDYDVEFVYVRTSTAYLPTKLTQGLFPPTALVEDLRAENKSGFDMRGLDVVRFCEKLFESRRGNMELLIAEPIIDLTEGRLMDLFDANFCSVAVMAQLKSELIGCVDKGPMFTPKVLCRILLRTLQFRFVHKNQTFPKMTLEELIRSETIDDTEVVYGEELLKLVKSESSVFDAKAPASLIGYIVLMATDEAAKVTPDLLSKSKSSTGDRDPKQTVEYMTKFIEDFGPKS